MQSPIIRHSCHGARGTALLLTLGAVVLLSALIIAFFSEARLNRQLAYSSTNLTRADQLARSSLEIVAGELRNEVADPTYSSAGNGGNASYPMIYRPLAPADALPQKVGVSGVATTNLFEVSANNLAIDPGSNGRPMGSSVLISAPSQNGRYLTQDRWFGSGGPGLGTNTTLPTWVYVTRGGVQTPSLATASDAQSSQYVIGRFAYTVYDIGGLMDANVAGYPQAASTDAPFKSSLAFADIGTVLGVSGLPMWRNTSTGNDDKTFLEWGAGIPRASGTVNSGALASSASGHLSAVAGDNAFFSRQDLLLAAQNSVAGLTAAQAAVLTHFSRAANAPSWAPATTTAANPDLTSIRFPGAATITHYDDLGNTTNYAVQPGDPLVPRRFSLAKLAWITSSGVKAGVSTNAVKDCFGLTWDGTNEQWNYQDSAINTLAQVAALAPPREPNFFELLKAGIVAGSTGLTSANQTYSDSVYQKKLDSTSDLQILRIGANIIDETSADNYPTTVTLPVAGVNVPVYGVKDLPYLYSIVSSYLSKVNVVPNVLETLTAPPHTTVTATEYQAQNLAIVAVPELFNPHAPSATPPSTGPTSLEIVITNGTFSQLNVSGSFSPQPLYRSGPFQPVATANGLPTVAINNYSNTSDPFRSGVTPVTSQGDSASAFSTLLPWCSDSNHGFLIYDYSPTLTAGDTYCYSSAYTSAIYTGATPYPLFSGILRASLNSDLLIELKYKSPKGVYRTYDTFCGNDAFADTGESGIGSLSTGLTPGTGSTAIEIDPSIPIVNQPSLNSPVTMNLMSKFDPRTSRFGIGAGAKYLTSVSAPLPPSGSTYNGMQYHLPFGSGSVVGGGSPGIFTGLWAQGGKTGWSDTTSVSNVADPDATVRPADGWLGVTGSLSAGTANPFQQVTTTTEAMGRPVILGRPFRSVAELGYVFRDNAWKSLSFFDSTSGDSALLDLFSVSDEPAVVAGKIELNSPQAQMQQALLSGASQSSDGSTSMLSGAAAIASAYQTYGNIGSVPSANYVTNPALLPTFMSSTALTSSAYSTSTTPLKNYRESVVRALASGTQTRTWNLLIDMVAQVGRFPGNSGPPTSLANFVVDGEKRYWLSIAIDRYTGKVLDEQWEPVNE